MCLHCFPNLFGTLTWHHFISLLHCFVSFHCFIFSLHRFAASSWLHPFVCHFDSSARVVVASYSLFRFAILVWEAQSDLQWQQNDCKMCDCVQSVLWSWRYGQVPNQKKKKCYHNFHNFSQQGRHLTIFYSLRDAFGRHVTVPLKGPLRVDIAPEGIAFAPDFKHTHPHNNQLQAWDWACWQTVVSVQWSRNAKNKLSRAYTLYMDLKGASVAKVEQQNRVLLLHKKKFNWKETRHSIPQLSDVSTQAIFKNLASKSKVVSDAMPRAQACDIELVGCRWPNIGRTLANNVEHCHVKKSLVSAVLLNCVWTG